MFVIYWSILFLYKKLCAGIGILVLVKETTTFLPALTVLWKQLTQQVCSVILLANLKHLMVIKFKFKFTNKEIKILKTVAIIILLLPWKWRIFHFYLSFDNQKNILIKGCPSICTSYCPLQSNSCTGVCHIGNIAVGGTIPPEKVLILKLCVKNTLRTY